jgi:nucleoside-diphosphate-sugar epimerase/MoaA/NifB/PqqE/SkfB family radical SAM enzyme
LTILVTGASGFIGKHLVNSLLRRGNKIRILARSTSKLGGLDLSKVDIFYGDLAEEESLHGIMKDVNIIYHCAAKARFGHSDKFYDTNVQGTRNLLEETSQDESHSTRRFVHMSSVAVMGENINHFGSNESHPYAKSWTEDYTPSKIEAEKAVIEYCRQETNLQAIILRPGWIWGPGDRNTLDICRTIMSGIVPCIGSGQNILPLTYINNIVDVLLSLSSLENATNVKSGETFIVTDNKEISQLQFLSAFVNRINPAAKKAFVPTDVAYHASHILEIVNSAFAIHLADDAVSRQNVNIATKNFRFSIQKAGDILNFNPTIDFETAVDESIRWVYDVIVKGNAEPKFRRKGELSPLLFGRTSMTHFAITSWCNAKCVFCSYPESKQRISVSLNDAIKAINSLKSLGVGILSLTGGEPFLNKDIFKIAAHASLSAGMLVFAGTNGVSMTHEDAFMMRRSGIRAIWISYEGQNDQTFDKNRGVVGLSDKIRQDLAWLREANVDTFAICVINKSITDYRAFIDHLIEIGFDKVKFDYPMTMLESGYMGFKDMPLVSLTSEEILDALDQIMEIKHTNYKNFRIINPTAGLAGAKEFYCGKDTRFKCAAGHKIFYLDWNLDLFRCTRLPEKFGKVFDVTPEQLRAIDCNKCYYQGTRDYDSIYHVIDSIERIGSSRENFIESISGLATRNSLDGIKSIFEIAKSGL